MKDEVGKVQVLSQETAADGHQFCVPTVFWRPRLYVVVWVGGGWDSNLPCSSTHCRRSAWFVREDDNNLAATHFNVSDVVVVGVVVVSFGGGG